MPENDIRAWLSDRPEIQSITVGLCDINGAFRGKRIPVSQAGKLIGGQMRMPLSGSSVDIWGRDVEESELVFASGDGDGICELTERGIMAVPWLDEPAAFAQIWLRTEDGTPLFSDARHALAAVLARYKRAGLTPVVAMELEFYLVDPAATPPGPVPNPVTGQPVDQVNVLSVDELDAFSGFLNAVYAAADIQAIPADAAISENAPGQFEVNLRHSDDALRAADDAVLFKRAVRGVARKRGLAATFMAKPFGHTSGSGLHMHFSVLDADGRNIFDDGGGQGTDSLRQAVGGCLDAMQDCTLIFAPHQNSYRRLRPSAHAPVAVTWGYENRMAAIRIPGGDPRARRIEHRVAGADANPYLVMAAILGAALDGIERRAKPPAPLTGDKLPGDTPRLPVDWSSAIARFGASEALGAIFDPRMQRLITQCKRQELMRFLENIPAFEYQTYLDTA